MSNPTFPQLAPTIFITALLAACANPKRVDEVPLTLMRNGERVESPTRSTDGAMTQALEARIAGHERRDSLTAVALSTCSTDVCAALGRGEVTLGMTEAQLLATTRTTDLAWVARRSGGVEVFSPRDADAGPTDMVGSLALVQLSGGRVSSIVYRESQGLRTVSTATDASTANQARAASLVQEGDALAAAGDFTSALDRYDRASVVTRADPELQYKMAASLDKLLRPVEAQLRYQLFLNQLEISRIEATGTANAKLADAIVHARERLIVLEKK